MKARLRPSEEGFTLVELLVSLLIFGMLSAAGVALLSFSVRAQDLASERLEQIGDFRRFNALLTSDLAQASPRLARDEAGAVRAAFTGGSGQAEPVSLSFVRRGWENLDGRDRSSLQKVQYRLRDGRLERIPFRFLDGSAPMDPAVVMEGVRSLRLRYRDAEGAWRERWDPVRPGDLPRAVEMEFELERGGPLRMLFLVGAGQ